QMSSRVTICPDIVSCSTLNGLSSAEGRRWSFTHCVMRPRPFISGFTSKNSSNCTRRGWILCIHCAAGVLARLRPIGYRKLGMMERGVESKVCLGYLGDGREAAIICCVVSTQFANVFERSRLAAHHPVAGYEIRIGRAVNLALQYRFVETGRKRIDEINIARELAVLLASHT